MCYINRTYRVLPTVRQRLHGVRSLGDKGLTGQLLAFSRRRSLNPKLVNPNELISDSEAFRQAVDRGVRGHPGGPISHWLSHRYGPAGACSRWNRTPMCHAPNGGVLTIETERRGRGSRGRVLPDKSGCPSRTPAAGCLRGTRSAFDLSRPEESARARETAYGALSMALSGNLAGVCLSKARPARGPRSLCTYLGPHKASHRKPDAGGNRRERQAIPGGSEQILVVEDDEDDRRSHRQD